MSNGDVCMDWMKKIESVFERKHYKDQKHIPLAKIKLRKGIMHWRGKVKSSKDTKHELENRYIQTTYRQDLSERIVSFKQSSMSVAEYSNEFHTLSRRAKVDKPEYIIVGHYKKCFTKAICDIMRISPITTIAYAFQDAINVESPLASIYAQPLQVFIKQTPPTQPSTTTTMPPHPTKVTTRRCFICQNFGHRSQDCPNKKTTLLVEESLDDAEIEEKMIGCAFTDLVYYPEVQIDPYFDYGQDYYEMPLPDSSMQFRVLPESRGE